MATVSIFVVLGMMSLAVDLGWGYYRREAAQSAADAAAAAVIKAAMTTSPTSQSCGVNSVWCGSPAGTITDCPATAPSSPSTSFDNGCMLASANGFTTTGSVTVSIQANTTSSPPTVPGASVSYWATVRISETPAHFFSSGSNPLTLNVRSTAAITTTGSFAPLMCLYVLSPNASDAFDLGNGASVTTSSCGVYVNSNASTAMLVTGGATLNSPSIKVVGGYQANNGGTISGTTPTTGAPAVTDPFATLPVPTIPGSCASGNFTNWQAMPYAPTAGCYSGFSVGNGMSAVLGAGTYVISGGSFSVQGGATLTTAAGGVMIYLTNGATVNIANGANVTMSAQSSGTYEGVLFYQDRTMTSPGSSTFAGGASMHLSGSLYLPNALLNINNGANAQTEAIIAGSVNFQGGATLNQATSQSQTGLSVGGSSSVSVIE
jgi:hypothetical protein